MVIDKNTSIVVKGIAICLIVIHHYTQNYGCFPDIFRGVGPMACSAFFLISGYGLSVNRSSYSKWIQRLLKLYVPFVLSNSFYILLFVTLCVYVFSPMRIITDFLGITLINGHCWFLQYLILFYILTAIVDVKLENNRSWLVPVLAMAGGGVFSVLTYAPGTLSWIAFPLGFILRNIELKRAKNLLKILSGLIGVVCFFCYFYVAEMKINSSLLLAKFILMCTTTPFALLFVGEWLKSSAALKIIGESSIDIYLMHGLIIILVGKMMLPNTLRVTVYLVSIAIAAYLFNRFQRMFFNIILSNYKVCRSKS